MKILDKMWKISNYKHQISPYRACGVVSRAHGNKSQITISKSKNKKFVLNIGILIFGIVWYLGFVVWNLSPQGIEQLQGVRIDICFR